MFAVRHTCALLFICLTAGTAAQVQAEAMPRLAAYSAEIRSPPSGLRSGHALSAADIAAFFDGIVPLQLERSDIAGATVLVMKDGQVLLEKGYGYSDVKGSLRVDARSTLFRVGSVSKLFTWIAVMQLVAQGRLDLDTDIQRYLDFPLKPAFAAPITLRNLMTHSGGFENERRSIVVIDPREAMPLRDFLIRNQPLRIFPPGSIPAYSNYGAGLAGYIIERVSGEPFERYVDEHIFQPLGMLHSSFEQPPAEPLRAQVAEGYARGTDDAPSRFEIFSPAPAGALSTTAADMARFGAALAAGGSLDGHAVLEPETLAAMFTPQYRASGQLPALGLGFYQLWRNQLRWIGHDGDLFAFHAFFFIEPEEKLVFFVSYNSASAGDQVRTELFNAFCDRYFPHSERQTFLTLPVSQARQIEGAYQSSKRADSNLLKLSALRSQQHLVVAADGGLTTGATDLRGHVRHWRPIGADLWQAVGSQERLFAIRNGEGRIVRIADDFSAVQLERVPWYENNRLIYPLLGACLILVALTAVFELVRSLRLNRAARRGTALATPLGFAAMYWTIFAIVFYEAFSRAFGNYSLPPTAAAGKYLLLGDIAVTAAIALSVAAAIAAASTDRRKAAGRGSRVIAVALLAAFAFLSWFSIHWKLFGPTDRF